MKVDSVAMTPLLVALLGLLATFVSAKQTVVDLTDTARFNDMIAQDRPALVEFFAPWCGHCKNLEPEYNAAAAAFDDRPGKVLIAKVDADANKELGRRFGVKGFPTILWFPYGSLEPEVYKGQRKKDAIVSFVNEKLDAAGGKLPIKSSDIDPASAAGKAEKLAAKALGTDKAGAVQLNAGNFDDLVVNSGKDVLVEFYAPWCGHCKNLAPIYNSIANVYENEDDCIIAQMDADEQTNRPIAQRYGVQSFPTIKFFSKNGGEPEAYPGGRAAEDFITYMNSKCGVHRLMSGGLSDLAGRLPSFDSIASRFYSASPDGAERMDLYGEAKAFAESVKGSVNSTAAKDSTAAYYLRIMTKTLEDPSYVEREVGRLNKIVQKHLDGVSQLTSRKYDELKRKINVLSAFSKRGAKDASNFAKQVAEDAKTGAADAAQKVRDEL